MYVFMNYQPISDNHVQIREMQEYYNSDVQWKLSAAEVKKILQQRVDFSAAAIKTLKL